ncbi:MAG: hypothetical protein AAB372_04375, partial [Patescibacteria group bacterium]
MRSFPFAGQIAFAFKAISIGAVLIVSLAASFFVQQVVNDRLEYQSQAVQNNSGDTSAVLIHGRLSGFDKETGISG